MTGHLREYLTGLVDYAGLFPPASLGLKEAIAEYRHHLEGPEAFLIDKFVCPVSNLPAFGELWGAGEDTSLTVIASPTAGKDFAEVIEADAQNMLRFQEEFGDFAEIVGYEVRANEQPIHQQLERLAQFEGLDLYLEVAAQDGLHETLFSIAESENVFAKFRTGGTQPKSHPASATLANFLFLAVDTDLGFKLTAGLHHPRPTEDPLTGDTMHGFLNVGLAVALALQEDLNSQELTRILDVKDPQSMLGDVKDWGAARLAFHGFGSCSIRDPFEDLRQLNLL